MVGRTRVYALRNSIRSTQAFRGVIETAHGRRLDQMRALSEKNTRPPLASEVALDGAKRDLLKMQALHHTASMEAGMEKLQCVVCHEEK